MAKRDMESPGVQTPPAVADAPKAAPVATAAPRVEMIAVPREEWERVKSWAQRAFAHIYGTHSL